MSNRKFSSIRSKEPQVGHPPSIDDVPDSAVDTEEGLEGVEWLPEGSRSYRAMKRLIDIVSASFALIAFAPLFLFVAIVIRFTSEGPVLYSQSRIGYRGKPFEFLKFRTMYVRDDREAHLRYVKELITGDYGPVGEQPAFKVSNDPRITPFGRFLRRTSLDELPQFWNVLRGEMTLVGPRPPIAYELVAYQPWQLLRLSSKPGLTGLWQIVGRSNTTFDEMVKLDLHYIENPSIFTDLKILLRTPVSLMRSDKSF